MKQWPEHEIRDALDTLLRANGLIQAPGTRQTRLSDAEVRYRHLRSRLKKDDYEDQPD